MRRYIFLIFILSIGGCAIGKTDLASKSQQGENGELRYDGLYYKEGVITQNRSYADNYTYLRFYPDGTVIRVATASQPDEAARWLKKNRTSQDSKYKLKGPDVSFAVNSNGDIMDYNGEVMENKIRMTVYSHGNTYIEDYYFMQIDLPSE